MVSLGMVQLLLLFSRAFNDNNHDEDSTDTSEETKPVRAVGIYGAAKERSSENRTLEEIVNEIGGELFKANQESKIVEYIQKKH